MSLIFISVSGGPGAVAQPYNREPQYSAAPQLVLSFLLNKKRLFTLVVILSNQKIKVYGSLPRLLARFVALAILRPELKDSNLPYFRTCLTWLSGCTLRAVDSTISRAYVPYALKGVLLYTTGEIKACLSKPSGLHFFENCYTKLQR